MEEINVTNYLPAKALEKEFHQVLADIVNYIISIYQVEFNDILGKYREFFTVRREVAVEVISEFGYKYILDILDLSDSEVQNVRALLNLIHFLKGSKTGLNVILDSLKLDTEIEEWWEQDPQGEPDTYKLTITGTENPGIINHELVVALKAFSRAYLYPILNLGLQWIGTGNCIPSAGTAIDCTVDLSNLPYLWRKEAALSAGCTIECHCLEANTE